MKLKEELLKFHKSFVKYRETINAYTTIALVLATIVLIVVTWRLMTVTNNLGGIEGYLAAEGEKQKVMTQITLSEDLLLETQINYEIITTYLTDILTYKNNTGFRFDFLQDTKIKQAKDSVGFGSENMRLQFNGYLSALSILKSDLAEIENAQRGSDQKVKNERIDNFVYNADLLINHGWNWAKFGSLINDTQNYIDERNKKYDSIDEEMEAQLKSFSLAKRS